MSDFRQAGYFRLMQPARYGGFEYGFTAFMDVIMELGRACTASAWNCAIGVSHQWLIEAGFSPEAQDDVWGQHPDAFACVYAPTGTAQRLDGGVLVQGRWQFVSNADNSDWAIVGASIPPAEKSLPPEAAFLLLPRESWSIEDDWHVAGQAGTGSKTICATAPTFVPEHRKLLVSAASAGASPGTALNRHEASTACRCYRRCRCACCRRCWAQRMARSSNSSNCAARA